MAGPYQGSYAQGSADRPHPTTADPWSPLYEASSSIDDSPTPSAMFMDMVKMALATSGIDINRLTLSQIYQIATTAWNDPVIKVDYQTLTQGHYGSVTDYTVKSGGLITDLINQMFTPGSSSDMQLLTLGIGLLQTQGKNLSQAQQTFAGNAGSQVPKIFQGNFPVTESHAEGDPGVDYGTPVGTQISTPFSGTVTLDRSGKGNWGNRVLVKLDNGYTFAVGHLTSMSVQAGQRVNPGDIIGYSGGAVDDPNSGITTGPHIEVQWIDPSGNFLDPTNLVSSIQAGTTFGAIGESGAVGTGVITPKFPGDDPALDAQYPGVVQIWQKYFGSPPTGNQISSVVGTSSPSSGSTSASGAPIAGTPQQFVGIIQQAAAQYGVSAALLSALLKEESGFNPNAVSGAGALGIAQFMPGTAAGAGVNPMDPNSAIPGAAKLLSQYYHDLGSWALALAAYNAGEGAARAYGVGAAQGNYVNDILGMAGSAGTSGTGAAGTAAPDNATIENTIRNMPSHIPGMNQGQYVDLKGQVDSVSQKALGHAATDGIIAELFNRKDTGAGDIQDFYDTHSPNELNAAQYANIVAANQPALQGIYNEGGFDPRWAQQQYTQSQMQQPGASGGGTGTPPVFTPPTQDPALGKALARSN